MCYVKSLLSTDSEKTLLQDYVWVLRHGIAHFHDYFFFFFFFMGKQNGEKNVLIMPFSEM